MGIPSYFVHIIKNHRNIIENISNIDIDNFFLDSNSIIYDCVYSFQKNNEQFTNIDLFNSILIKIAHYINNVKPRKLCYIAIDGVAPVAKLKQQRQRRYKNNFQNNYLNQKNTWNTTQITPGTSFMNELDIFMKNNLKSFLFENCNINIQKLNLIYSGSDKPGEGEHKIFNYIRNNNKTDVNAIYGLDADLIMLSMNHLTFNNQIYLYRETPHFISNIDSSLTPHKSYILNIPLLTKNIIYNLTDNTNESDIKYIKDYVFMFFLLGNDFLPHFPSLNIRSNGIDCLLNIYYNELYKGKKMLIVNNKIIWKHVRILISKLHEYEYKNICNEYQNKLNKNKSYRYLNNDSENFINIPLLDLSAETYINPHEKHWQKRYYKLLLNMNYNESNIKNLCLNYVEGLEWNIKYYSGNCTDWEWSYKYNYPPLFEDLIKYIPYFDTIYFENEIFKPINPFLQLAYVIPKSQLSLLPKNIENKIKKDFIQCYPDNINFHWAFCRYFWESHPVLPDINIQELDNYIS